MASPPPPPHVALDEGLSVEQLAKESVATLLERGVATGVGRALSRRYLSALRSREDAEGQVASVLLLFHMARRGDNVAQVEFMLLRPALAAAIPATAPAFLGKAAELHRLWDEVKQAMSRADPRERVPVFPFKGGEGPEVALFEGDADLPDFDFDPEVVEAERETARSGELRNLVTKSLGQDLRQQVVHLGQMLDLSSAEDLDRLQSFLRSVGAWATIEAEARGLACLGYLYLAVNLRRHTIFSTLNQERVDALRIGLSQLAASSESAEMAAAFLASEGGHIEGFHKVLELIIDFMAWCHQRGLDPGDPEAIEAYSGEGRLPPMVLSEGTRRRR